MKNVLMIAYQFPPMGGSGVQRTTKFVKYLNRFGWNPSVFTRTCRNIGLRDDTLLADIPGDVNIIRSAAFDLTELPKPLIYPGKFIARKVMIPDAEMLWQLNGRKHALKSVREGNIPVIYTTSYPYSDHLMGLYIKRHYPKIKWVADFRDEWTNNPYLIDSPHPAFRMNIEKKMERIVMLESDLLITNTRIMRENFLTSYRDIESLDKRFHVIPNGFDRDDFMSLPKVSPSNSKFTITYTGALYGRRKPDIVFNALKKLKDAGKLSENDIRLNLIGNFKAAELQNKINQYKIPDIVNILPYIQHEECLLSLMKSDALLLLEGAGPGAEAFSTGKVFEYINTGRPILAVIPKDGVAAEVVYRTQTGLISDCRDLEKTAGNIYELYKGWLNGKLSTTPDQSEIKKYDRINLTKQLAGLFEAVTEQPA